MDQRWAAIIGIGSVAILFVPVFMVILAARRTEGQRAAMRDRHVAQYKHLPEANLLRLND
jgi:hypothetical protein